MTREELVELLIIERFTPTIRPDRDVLTPTPGEIAERHHALIEAWHHRPEALEVVA